MTIFTYSVNTNLRPPPSSTDYENNIQYLIFLRETNSNLQVNENNREVKETFL